MVSIYCYITPSSGLNRHRIRKLDPGVLNRQQAIKSEVINLKI